MDITGTENKTFACNICEINNFKNQNEVSQHFLKVHQNIKCYICDQNVEGENFELHFLEKHSIDIKNECESCNVTFETLKDLEEHQRNIHKLVDFKCDFCNKIFKNRAVFIAHIRYTHKEIDKSRHICNICNKGYHRKFELNNHVSQAHTDKLKKLRDAIIAQDDKL